MAVAEMTKVSILAPQADREMLVDALHRMGAAHIIDLTTEVEGDEEAREICVPFEPNVRGLNLDLSRTDFLIDLFSDFGEKKKGFFKSMLKERTHVDYQEYIRIKDEVDLESLYGKAEALDVEVRRLDSRVGELQRELETLSPWEDLAWPLRSLGEYEFVDAMLLVMSPQAIDSWSRDLEELCPFSTWEEIHRDVERAYVVAIVHRDSIDEFNQLSQRFNAESIQFRDREGTPPEEIRALNGKVEKEREMREETAGKIREMVPFTPKILTLYDYIYNLILKEEVKGRFANTERAFAIEGWIEKGREEDVRHGLATLGDEIDISFSEPGEDDATPTLIKNPRRLLPVQVLVRLFGPPDRAETDPTWIMAPFFILFFGLCMGDVGYGIIIFLLFWWMQKKLDVSDNVKCYLRLFMYCGVATVICGVFTRSYFGISLEKLPKFLQFKGTVDILTQPIPLMIFCLALGLLHISIGTAIEMFDNARNNSWWLAFCEQGTTLILWLGLAVLGLGLGLKQDVVTRAGLYTMAAGAVGIIILSNISAKSVAGKIGGGAFNFYGSIGGTIGDVASYLRLYALGLATVAIADVINRLGVMVLVVPAVGILFMLVILIVGHSFNLVINMLGAFVHPLRLHYVEFFGKFYEDGGVPFTPLALTARKTVIEKERS